MLYREESPEKRQYNMAAHPFLDTSLPILSYPVFPEKIFRPFSPSPHSFLKGCLGFGFFIYIP